jgi:hypothetical protein
MQRIAIPGLLAALLTAPAGVQAADPASPRRLPARAGSVAIKVARFEDARPLALAAAFKHGGELLDARTETDFQGKRHGWLRFRLPSDRLSLLIAEIRSVGKLYSEKIETADHASEHEELERRVGRLREHQQRLDRLLSSSRRLRGSDILYIQERLFRAGVDEGLLLQRRLDLERGAQSCTLVVSLFEPEPPRSMDWGDWYAGAALRAKTDLLRVLARATTAGAYALFFAPFWLPALLLAVFVGRWLWRRGRALAGRARAACARWLEQSRRQAKPV